MPPSRPLRRVLVTGGSGFVGSALLRALLARPMTEVLNYDALAYAGLHESTAELGPHPRYRFVHADVTDGKAFAAALDAFTPDTLIHLAAESHVDRSIADPASFVRTNVEGTATVLRGWREYRDDLAHDDLHAAAALRLVHVSTDEVYGPQKHGELATATSSYRPSSPYAATKAAADHLVRSYARTYGVQAMIVCPTNNYGPRQFPEKLIPVATLAALRGKPIPLYGDGSQVRDWLHVEDCAAGLIAAAESGDAGATCHLGASLEGQRNEWTNLDVLHAVCDAVDELTDASESTRRLITRVADRPGHDARYALDSTATRESLGWRPTRDRVEGIRDTVLWYHDNADWVAAAESRR